MLEGRAGVQEMLLPHHYGTPAPDLNTASAEGLRQMLPKHTNSTCVSRGSIKLEG